MFHPGASSFLLKFRDDPIVLFIYLYFVCSKIEVAYQEAVALKRQEELIREEEAAWMAEGEQKSKRGASVKEKKSKKKQVFYLNAPSF